ncbi:GNAT family N-acetyltransferase [Micromonospora sp. DSM 115977]|uniref:GNAT family N-acetyltransferase n=1 Tax=Micromonospora reichwaldensis TaxID=3075516 RepID=A0ABU2WVY4_9ACTN|nr:GNAT family N-acetyltransferase [Micromonospora sp. DSM 115977]MDT0529700.1 GNAT family N-acetyltransferase [Micromonospora sp. DSM 115977]
MLADLWPLYGLTISTPRLELRLPREEELAELAHLAGRGVHRPDERPFLTPWTDGGPEDRARAVLQGHWGRLGDWSDSAWRLGLGVFRLGHPLGVVTLGARDFRVVRQVTTSSWLGIEHQGRGYGTEARAGLLTLAFDHLGAEAALTEVFQDNHSSQGVSRKLGYEHDGISVDARGDEALVSDRLRLTRAKWRRQERPAATVHGVAACLPMFGR